MAEFRVQSSGDDADDWTTIQADEPGEAAERYVEHLCDGDSEHYGTNPHHVLVFVVDGPPARFDVEIDWSATFTAWVPHG